MPRVAAPALALLLAACAERAVGPRAAAPPAPRARLAIRENWAAAGPPCALLVLDGVAHRQRVARGRCAFPAGLALAPEDVVSVTVLRPAAARAAYGPGAAAGALVVVTRRPRAGTRAGAA